jgi:NADH-quinone oxidoreductase subunit K
VTIGLTHYLVLSAVLFCIGLFGALTRRNAVIILMCIELMLNSVNIILAIFRGLADIDTNNINLMKW